MCRLALACVHEEFYQLISKNACINTNFIHNMCIIVNYMLRSDEWLLTIFEDIF